MKLDDWIKPYAIDRYHEETDVESEIVAYTIPSYKIDRLREADDSATELQDYRSLGTPEECKSALEKAIECKKYDNTKIGNLIKQVKLLERSIEVSLPSMLPKLKESAELVLKASKGIFHE